MRGNSNTKCSASLDSHMGALRPTQGRCTTQTKVKMTTENKEFYSPVARDLTNTEIRASAYDRNHRDDGTLMVDTFNTVARYRAGAYVQAWVWMPYDEVREDKKDPDFTHKTRYDKGVRHPKAGDRFQHQARNPESGGEDTGEE